MCAPAGYGLQRGNTQEDGMQLDEEQEQALVAVLQQVGREVARG